MMKCHFSEESYELGNHPGSGLHIREETFHVWFLCKGNKEQALLRYPSWKDEEAFLEAFSREEKREKGGK